MSKTFIVTIPIAGSMSIELDGCADDASKEDAIERAWEIFNESGDAEFHVEWEALESVGEGNVNHCPCSRQSAREVKQ